MEAAVVERRYGVGVAMESAEALVELVRSHEEISNFAGGCTPEMLQAAEEELGVDFPPSFRRLVGEFGTWDNAGLEFLGVYQTLAMGNELLGSVRATRDARASLGLPASMIEVMEDDLGLVVLDTVALDEDGEAPVLSWTPDGRAERLGDNFGDYALAVCEAAVRSWRS